MKVKHTLPDNQDAKALFKLITKDVEQTKFFREILHLHTEALLVLGEEYSKNKKSASSPQRLKEIDKEHERKLRLLYEKIHEQRRLYKKISNIEVKKEENQTYLYFFITSMLAYNLTEEGKKAELKKHSPSAEAEIVEIARKKHLLFKVRAKMNPGLKTGTVEYYQWILDCIRNNALMAQLIAAEWASDQNNFERL